MMDQKEFKEKMKVLKKEAKKLNNDEALLKIEIIEKRVLASVRIIDALAKRDAHAFKESVRELLNS